MNEAQRARAEAAASVVDRPVTSIYHCEGCGRFYTNANAGVVLYQGHRWPCCPWHAEPPGNPPRRPTDLATPERLAAYALGGIEAVLPMLHADGWLPPFSRW